MPDWKNAADYGFTRKLTLEEWAWQFLRRNPDYQRDWRWFAATWSALEAEYGQPPARDYFRWQQDPRAYREGLSDAGEATGPLLIECWMGHKWGFYKFPLDPAMEHPQVGTQLLWREVAVTPCLIGESDNEWLGDDPAKVAWGFDLRQPLGWQFEQAQRFLRVLQKQRSQNHSLRPETPAQQQEKWRRYLRYLDAEAVQATCEEIVEILQLDELNGLPQQAHEMIQTGYRRILILSMATTRTKTL